MKADNKVSKNANYLHLTWWTMAADNLVLLIAINLRSTPWTMGADNKVSRNTNTLHLT